MFSEISIVSSFFATLGIALILGAASGACGAFVAIKKETCSVNIISAAAFSGILVSYALCGSHKYFIALAIAIIISLLASILLKLFYLSMNTAKFALQAITLSGFIGLCVMLYSYLHSNGYSVDEAERLFLGSSSDMLGAEMLSVVAVSLLFLVVIAIFFKKFEIILFDKAHASSVGINEQIYSLLFKILCVLLIIVSLHITGVFLTGAAFIIPFLATRLLVCGFGKAVFVSACYGAGIYPAATAISGFFPVISSGPAVVILSLMIWGLSYLCYKRLSLKKESERISV